MDPRTGEGTQAGTDATSRGGNNAEKSLWCSTSYSVRFACPFVLVYSWFGRGFSCRRTGQKKYWQAWKLAEEMIGDRPVNFVEIETAKESLKRVIQRYGVEL